MTENTQTLPYLNHFEIKSFELAVAFKLKLTEYKDDKKNHCKKK
jgi:hypothetical protein